MAPSPENDDNPKAPDKCDKQKTEKTSEAGRDEKTLSNLNDGELKALLDEAMDYKNPKDREGKSKLFKALLNQAEETERIARAASAGGSELVRHCNPSARRHHQRRGAGGAAGGGGARRKPSSASVSEAALHGGSLDNLAKEELYGPAAGHRAVRKTVSARQREGGSLPCNVNSTVTPARDYQFLEEAKRSKAMKDKEYTAIDMETESLLENDHLAQSYQEQERELSQPGPKYTSRATFQITGSAPASAVASASVDDRIPFALEDAGTDMRSGDVAIIESKLARSQYNVYIQKCGNRESEEKKTDENGNAVHQAKSKKKKFDKNVVVIPAESVEGHRSEIINDVNKLMQYIEGTDNLPTGKNKSNIQKSKQLHKQHNSEDGGRNKKQRAHSSKGKEPRAELKKSNSLGEISTTKLDAFVFASGSEEADKEEKVVLRTNKPQSDRPRERRSWGNVEAPSSFQTLYTNTSVENLETSDNWVVSKTKKKSKKRRNSISSSRRQTVGSENAVRHISNRAPSPDLRGKSAFSMPHSEKSNDSSDADSVHSLPIDGPISYADIAKNSEKAKDKKPTPEKTEKTTPNKEKTPQKLEPDQPKVEAKPIVPPVVNNVKNLPPPDVHNIKSFPSIASTVNKVTEKTKTVANNKKTKTVKAKGAEKGVAAGQEVHPDLAIMQASDAMGLNAHTLPPDVPDVRTIEKMQFLNRLTGPVMVHAHCCSALHHQVPPHILQQQILQQQLQHQQLQQHHQPPLLPPVELHHKPLTPPKTAPPSKTTSPPVPTQQHLVLELARSPAEPKRVAAELKKPQEQKKLSPEPKKQSPEPKKPSPEPKKVSPEPQQLPRQQPEPKKGTPEPPAQKSQAEPKKATQELKKSVVVEAKKGSPEPQQQIPPQHQQIVVQPQLQQTITHQQTVIMQQQVVIPQQQAVVPQQQAVVPQQQAVVPQQQTIFPQCQAVLSQQVVLLQQEPQQHEERKASPPPPELHKFQFDGLQQQQQHHYVSPEQVPGSPDAPASCDSERTLSCDEGEEGPPPQGIVVAEPCPPPPVVILSGGAGKGGDVPGLVFGFDVNEQLLRDDDDDVSENFAARYMPPNVFSRTSHNHDKIVNFIGMAWESIVNGNVEYYSEDL